MKKTLMYFFSWKILYLVYFSRIENSYFASVVFLIYIFLFRDLLPLEAD